MSLYAVVPPYEWADQGPPLSEWERSDACLTDKFRQAFPNGVVPIRHVPTLGVRSQDPHEWASEMLARFEAARGYVDMDRLDDLGSHWLLLWSAVEPTPTTRYELNTVTKELLGLGLPVRVLAAYLCVTPREFAVAYYTGRPERVDAFLLADELLHQGKSSAEVRLATGFADEAVRRLRRAKGLPEETRHAENAARPDREQAFDLAAWIHFVETDGTLSSRKTMRLVHERLPSSREWFTHHHVYNITQRFPEKGRARVAATEVAA